MTIEREIVVNKNINDAWKVLGTEFAEVHRWASAVNHSSGTGNSFHGASCSERGCDIQGMGRTKEQLIRFSNEEYVLSYTVPEGMPSIVKYATNTWQLTSLGPNQSKLKMKIDITLGGFMGVIMQPMMKMMMGKMSITMTEDFKYYVETGFPSAKKVKAMRKHKN